LGIKRLLQVHFFEPLKLPDPDTADPPDGEVSLIIEMENGHHPSQASALFVFFSAWA
jgi:hypothetical protein